MLSANKITIAIAVALIATIGTGCVTPCGSRGPLRSNKECIAPVLELTQTMGFIRAEFKSSFYRDGKIVTTFRGQAVTNYVSVERVKILLAQLERNGFLDINNSLFESEIQIAMVALGEGLSVVDGCNVSLTMRGSEITNTVTWCEPRIYSNKYPSAASINVFADCIDAVIDVIPKK